MALARNQGPVAGLRSNSSWGPSAPPSNSLFSDLNPVPASSTGPQHPSSVHRAAQRPSSSAYPSFQQSPANQSPSGAPMESARGMAAQSLAASQAMQQTHQAPHGPAAWQNFPDALPSRSEEHECQYVQQHPMQSETAAAEVSPEEQELQYMQQQQHGSAASQTGNIPAEFQLPPSQRSSGNPFDRVSSHSAASSASMQQQSIAGAQPLTGDHSKLCQSNHHPASTLSSSAAQAQPQASPGAMFPSINYDWANPAAAGSAEQQGGRAFHASPGAPSGPSWPPSEYNPQAGNFGPPGPQGFGPPYGPPGPPMGPPGFNQYGPPPMYYPPPPGPPPIVYVDDPYYHAHNRHVGLAAGGLGGLALGALLF